MGDHQRAELFGGSPEAGRRLVVQFPLSRPCTDLHAAESEVGDAALQLTNGQLRVLKATVLTPTR
ncbi:hypothetical protein QQY66_11465 [Streptomyces sp. DG2A-72]|nr:hypothetical protein [Streptomyces sp. DG2A-72]MDO0932275.1 hypothetical protein [Streptomyces sp. DG2A-72]